MSEKNCLCVAIYKMCMFGSESPADSEHFFLSLFRVVVDGDVGESDVLLLCAHPVTYFSLLVEADHQLVDHHADEGAEERGQDGHQEPAVSDTEEADKTVN